MPTNCSLNTGRALQCQTIGGVQEVYLGTWSGGTQFTYDADNVITGITSVNEVYHMEMDIEFSGLEQEMTASRENGTIFYNTNLTLKFLELDKDLRNLLIDLGRSPLFAVIKSNAGHYYFAGVESAGRAESGTASLGVALGDHNGASFVINWKSGNGVYLMEGALLGTAITIG
jgi:hypothetical protein